MGLVRGLLAAVRVFDRQITACLGDVLHRDRPRFRRGCELLLQPHELAQIAIARRVGFAPVATDQTALFVAAPFLKNKNTVLTPAP